MTPNESELAPLTGDDIRRIRERLGLSGAELSEAMGADRITIYRWEIYGGDTVRVRCGIYFRLLHRLNSVTEIEAPKLGARIKRALQGPALRALRLILEST